MYFTKMCKKHIQNVGLIEKFNGSQYVGVNFLFWMTDLQAEVHTDEVFAQITLLPVTEVVFLGVI